MNFQSKFEATTPVFPLKGDDRSESPNDVGILPPKTEENSIVSDSETNFHSNFKATTPVFPLTVDVSSEAPRDAGILPPEGSDRRVPFKSDFKATTPVFPVTGDDASVPPDDLGILPPGDGNVPFKSNYKATTPAYDVEVANVPLRDEQHIGFASNFTATTPVYPRTVEATSPDPGAAGLVAPKQSDNAVIPDTLLSLVPPEYDPEYEKKHDKVDVRPSEPSQFYQPPKFQPDYTSESNVILGPEMENIMKSLSREQWQNIRQRFHIPEYDFPLDDATRPSYDSVFSSFGGKPS